jgi:preprotein translocase subunit SecB
MMNEDIIQNQIKLIGFKASQFSFKTEVNPERKQSNKKQFELDLSNVLFADSPNHFIKVFKVDLTFDSPEFDEIYDLRLEYHVVFECSLNVTEEFFQTDFAKISASAIGFPYVRAFISTFSVQAGIPPLILPSINFIQFSNEQDKKKMENTMQP